MEIALGVIVLIMLLITWEAVKYSSQKKRINERTNTQNDVRGDKKKKAPKSRTKATKNKVSDNDKPRKSVKTKKKSLKDKN